MNKETGIELIATERRKQIEKDGWDSQHDSDHENYELTKAAICYAHRATKEGMCIWNDRIPNDWPFEAKAWKPEPRNTNSPSPLIEQKDAIKMLVKAGALIAAEIDRIQNLPIID